MPGRAAKAVGSAAAEGADALDEKTVVPLAKAWYDTDRRSPSQGACKMIVPVLGAYRNSAAAWSLLYRVEPDMGTTFLWRYKFTRSGSSWKVASASEDSACMHADDDAGDLPNLDETTAVKAAKRWYDKHFYGGAFSMCLPHVGAYNNRAQGFPRMWSLRYRATGPEVDPGAEFFVQFKYAAERKKGLKWKWRVVSLDLSGSDAIDAAAPARAQVEDETATASNPAKQAKRARLTVGSSSAAHGQNEAASSTEKKRKVALTVGSSSSSSSASTAEAKSKATTITAKPAAKKSPTEIPATSARKSKATTITAKPAAKTAPTETPAASARRVAPTTATALGKESALKAAKMWYESEQQQHRGDGDDVTEMVPLKIYKNNDRECSLLYRTEPNATGNTYLHRFKFAPPSDTNGGEWSVKSRPYEDDAAMHEDSVGPPEVDQLDELDEQTAIKAAKRWYDEYFDAGGNEMDTPVLAAYRNTERGIELSETREWSLRYTANFDPTEHFIRFKYRAEYGQKGWKWRAYGYSEEDEPSEHVGNSVEGYAQAQLESTKRGGGGGGGAKRGTGGTGAIKPAKRAKAKKSIATSAATAAGTSTSDTSDGAGSGAADRLSKGKGKGHSQAKSTAPAAVGSQASDADAMSTTELSSGAAMKARIREPKRDLVELPYVLPSPESTEEPYMCIGGPTVCAVPCRAVLCRAVPCRAVLC
jgi:hypothetical protein|eukprot:COSAG06_NODE_4134_length_4538_cov_24.154990_3_plen_704_part_00